MYVPWKPLDIVKQGRERWNRRKSWRARYGLHNNPVYWVVDPKFAPFVTGYGVLVSKVYHKYSGVTPGLQRIYDGFTHDLIRVLAANNIAENDYGKALAANAWLRGSIGYKVAGDLFNKVIGRSNRAIVSASARLAESNLSNAERKKIENMIANSNNMICIYDFDRDYLFKPPR